MNNLVIDEIETMDEQEQKRYFDKLKAQYKREIKELKEARRENDIELLNSCSWRAILLASAVGLVAGAAIISMGNPAMHQVGNAILAGSGVGAIGSAVAATLIEDGGIANIKYEFEAAREATAQISVLNKQIKNMEKEKVSVKR